MGRLGHRILRLLLMLYPASIRRRDGAAMIEVVECRVGERAHGRLGVAVREAFGLARAGLAARFGAPRGGAGPVRVARRGQLSTGALQDVRFAVRALRRNPAFTVISVATLALGIGINVGIFSLVNAVLLRPLPYPDADRLVTIRIQRSASKAIQDRMNAATTLDAIVAHTTWGFTITDIDEPQVASGGLVTANFFDVFGGTPLLGRTFVASDATAGNDDVAVISEALWRQHYGADPDIVGRRVDISNDHHPSRLVIGVMPPSAPQLSEWHLWVPLRVDPADEEDYFSSYYLSLIGRVAEGVGLPAVRAELDTLLARLAEDPRIGLIHAETSAALQVRDMHETEVGSTRPMLLMLLGAVASVLLIACSNVANLLLARSGQRAGELAIRSAMGAGRGRLARQLLTESLVIGLLAGLLGTAAAAMLQGVLRPRLTTALPRADTVSIDASVALYAVAISLVAALAFGLVPALRASQRDLTPVLRDGGRGAGSAPRQRRLAGGLIIAEVALASALVVTAGLLVRSLVNLQAAPSGFDQSEVVTLRVSPPTSRYDRPRQRELWSELGSRLQQVPGVEAAGAIHLLPLQPGNWSFPILPEGFTPDPDASLPDANFRVVTPGYFEAMGIQRIAGRDFDAGDTADADGVAIINRTLAERFWPEQSALEREVKLFGTVSLRVVGVVEDVRQHRLDRAGRMELYQPHPQWPLSSMVIAARTDNAPVALAAIQQLIREVDAQVPVHNVATMSEVVATSLGQPRLAAGLLSGFALLALALGVIGVYGVTSYAVSRRTHEIGIRMALGSRRREVVREVIAGGMRPVVGGLALGLAGAWLAGSWLEGLLFEVDSSDPATFAVVGGVLVVAGLIAGYLPARRASRVDPVVALRGD